MNQRAYLIPNENGPTEAVAIDEKLCIGCNACANICRTQTILKNPIPGKPPLVVYPDECWFCACCVEACPTGALQMRQPIGRRILFRRRETGEIFRIGQSNPPRKTFFRPPYGELKDAPSQDIWLKLNDKHTDTIAVLPLRVCAGVAWSFHWENVPEKLVSLLHDFGFRKVYENVSDLGSSLPHLPVPDGTGTDSSLYVVLFDKTDSEPLEENVQLPAPVREACHHYRQSDLENMILRASVSMYTAVHLWEELPLTSYDSPDGEY